MRSFQDIFSKVPFKQREQFKLFRDHHPVKHSQIDQVLWEYVVCGHSSKCLTLLAGGARFYDIWYQLILALETDYKIISITLPNLSKMTDIVEGISSILHLENINHTHLLGTSFGGLIAQCYVRSYPDQIEKMILSNTMLPDSISKTYSKFVLQIAKIYPNWILRRSTKWNMKLIMTISKSNRAFWNAYWNEKTQTHLRIMTREECLSQYKLGIDLASNYHFTEHDLKEWTGEIYLIESSNDLLFIRKAQKPLRSVYPNAQVHRFYKAGHTPGYSKADEFSVVIKKYLTN